MTNRVESLPEDRFVQDLQQIRRELDDIKKRQLTGQNNVLTFFNEPDTHITASAIPAYNDKLFNVFFYPNSGQRTYNFLEIKGTVIGGTGFESWTWSPNPDYADELTFSVWTLYFFNDGNVVDIDFQAGFRSIEEGTVEWAAI